MGLTVEPLPGTQILQLGYVSPDPDYSARVLNTLCDKFKNYDYQSKAESYAQARQWLQDKIAEMKTRLSESEQALIDFTEGSSADYVALSNNAQDYYSKLDATEARLAELEDRFNILQYQDSKLRQGVAPALVLDGDGGAAAAALQAQLDALEVQKAGLTQTFGPRMSQVKELEASMASLRVKLDAELERVRARVGIELARATAERDRLRASIDNQQGGVMEIQGKLSRYNILRRDVEINTQLLDNLVQKWKEIGLSQGLNASNVSILEAAVPPLGPLPGHSDRILLVCIVLGLGLGVGLVFFLNYMDVSFRSADEITRMLHLPVMGAIPFCEFGRRRRRDVQPELIVHQRPYSGYADCFRGLRTSAQFAVGNGKCRKFIVSSALPEEGKTTVAVNLAVSFAQKGSRRPQEPLAPARLWPGQQERPDAPARPLGRSRPRVRRIAPDRQDHRPLPRPADQRTQGSQPRRSARFQGDARVPHPHRADLRLRRHRLGPHRRYRRHQRARPLRRWRPVRHAPRQDPAPPGRRRQGQAQRHGRARPGRRAQSSHQGPAQPL
jgi:hypothetical protein